MPVPSDTLSRQLRDEIEDTVKSVMDENPDVGEDDVYHDITMSICQGWYKDHPAEVEWVMQTMYGWSPAQVKVRFT